MKRYVFYTTDGYSQDSKLKETENCQIIGFSQGKDVMEAYDNLLKDNLYIQEFQYESIMANEIIGDTIVL